MQKGRPTQLSLSPSDPALGATAKAVVVEQEEEDRAVLSDVGRLVQLFLRFSLIPPAERHKKLHYQESELPVRPAKLNLVDREIGVAQIEGSDDSTIGQHPTQRRQPTTAGTAQT